LEIGRRRNGREGKDVKVREGWEEGSDGKGRERKPGERG